MQASSRRLNGSDASRPLLSRSVSHIVTIMLGAVLAMCLSAALVFVISCEPDPDETLRIVLERAKSQSLAELSQIDPEKALVYELDLRSLPRPASFKKHPQKTTERADHAQLAQRAIEEAKSLKDLGISFRLIIYGWQRRASLLRLLKSLSSVDYYGFPVHIDFHMDGSPHPLVVKLVEEYKWGYGRVRFHRHEERVGLEKTIMSSWNPVKDTEFAFLFEDDIEVSRYYFDYSLVCLHKYVFPGGRRAPSSSWNDRLIGISLNTPRFNELNIPIRNWTPQETIGNEEDQFLFQIPCSWGALYFPWAWRQFLEYYTWRKQQGKNLQMTIPDSRSNDWTRSWKRYLVDMMFMRGQLMIYPSLRNQQSFSTHHRELGEHTQSGAISPSLDHMGLVWLYYFTVPLSQKRDQHIVDGLLANMKPLRELPVVSFYHERVADVYSLDQLGLFTAQLMKNSGWTFPERKLDTGCLLDEITHPVLPEKVKNGRKYLFYEPQGSLYSQLCALQNALLHATLLDRILILPLICASKNQNIQMALQTLVDIKSLPSDIKTMPFEKILERKQPVWVDRVVKYVPWSHRTSPIFSEMTDKLLVSIGSTPLSEVAMYQYSSSEKDVSRNFGTCQDQILAFRQLFDTYYNWDHTVAPPPAAKWTFKLASPITEMIEKVRKSMESPLLCIAYSHGDDPLHCGGHIERFQIADNDKKAFIHQHCKATLSETIQYGIRKAGLQSDLANSIYILSDVELSAGFPDDVRPSAKQKIYLRSDIRAVLAKDLQVVSREEELKFDLINFVEMNVCASAEYFEGNPYYYASNQLTQMRRSNV